MTTHILVAGRPLCGLYVQVPGDWPDGHNWVHESDFEESTCHGCRCVSVLQELVTAEEGLMRFGDVRSLPAKRSINDMHVATERLILAFQKARRVLGLPNRFEPDGHLPPPSGPGPRRKAGDGRSPPDAQ